MVKPMAGLSSPAGVAPCIMPASAWAALASTTREMRLRPATSTTEYIIVMSLGPT